MSGHKRITESAGKRQARETGDRDAQSLDQPPVAASEPDLGLALSLTLQGPVGREAASPLTGYLEALHLVERLYRRLLDVISDEFERAGRSDVNAVQALLLFNIGDSDLTAGELRTRGYYLGSDVSSNLEQLVEAGFIHHQRSLTDHRSVRVGLTGKGRDVANMVSELYQRHLKSIDQIGGIGAEDFQLLNRSLQRLERFWTDQILYRL